MKDYYKILGVKETASDEEIRERWLRWMRELHPDHVGAQKADERRVREINEAYEVLKYSDSRARYDLGKVYERKRKADSLRRAFFRKSYLLLLPAFAALAYLSLHEEPSPPVSHPVKESSASFVKPLESRAPEEENLRFKAWQSLRRPPVFVGTGEARPKDIERASPKGKAGGDPLKAVEETPVRWAAREPATSSWEREEEPTHPAKDGSKAAGGAGVRPTPEESRDSTALLREKKGTSTEREAAGNGPQPMRVLVNPDDVEKFFEDYLRCYTQKDIESFLGLFSARAVQNRKENFDEIKRIYSQFFDQSESLLYHLKHPTIEIFPGKAQVKASYEIKQVLKNGDTRFWKGNIEWALIRENGELRISSIQYQHDRSP